MTTIADVPELVPARMLNEYAYCPRLFFLEWRTGSGRPAVTRPRGTGNIAASTPEEGRLRFPRKAR